MERLSNELLRVILDFIQADPDNVLNIDRRAYLSVESFKSPSPPLPAQAHDVANFRLVCRRFAELGIPHQFTRLSTRFSKKGFARLEGIADCPALAKQVKKFSYMIPCFYVEGKDRLEELFQAFQGDLGAFDVGHFIRKAADQRAIVTSREDLRVLKKAISSFTSLQHVQILRLQDEPDRVLLDYIRENYEAAMQYVELKWTPACVHGTRTIGQALLEGSSSFTRFSGPMMNPQSLLEFQADPSEKVSALANRLTCLELHFDEHFELDHRMRQLSGLFRNVFTAATGMQAVHIGFPSRTPLGLGLEEIFHHVYWERLRAFGIQAWRLDAEEIIGFARRHRRTLRGLRLRDVLLKEPSMWKTILMMLRKEMECLEWVSLRRIGYTRFFDENIAGTMEVLPEPPGGEVSDSNSDDDDEDDEQEFTTHLNGNANGGVVMNHDDQEDHGEEEIEYDYDDSDSLSADEDDEHGPEAHELSMEPDPDTPSSVPWCNCLSSSKSNRAASIINWETTPSSSTTTANEDDLGDDGKVVVNWQRKLWEKWVVGRCPEHGL